MIMDTPHIIVLLHPASFEHLEQITVSAQLTKCIRTITVTGLRIRQPHDLEAKNWTPNKDILVRAFKSFPNLESIHVDSFSIFQHKTGQGVLRCGADSIGDQGCSHSVRVDRSVYDLVLQALFDADKHLSVAIHLDFPSPDGETPPGLSLSSAYWRMCSPQVRSLTFSGYTDTEWHRRLLQSTPSLQHLTFNSCGTLEVTELTQNILPGLHSFELDGAFCSASELMEFLNRQQHSMAEVKMMNVSVSKDIWSELKELIRNMPKLKASDLSDLGVHSD